MSIWYQFPSNNVKFLNKRIILDMIRFAPSGTSRAELARQIGLTRAAVTAIVNDMLTHSLAREIENGPTKRTTTGGRRPVLLEINPKYGCVVGIDMGATHLGLVATDFSSHVLYEIEIPFNVELGPEVCLRIIDAQLRELLTEASLDLHDILAIGMGVPGPVVTEAGVVRTPPIMPGWDNYPIRTHLQDLWQRPVSLNNDAELGALGEWAYGAGRGESYMAYIKVGSGVGAGLLLDGHIYRGATGCAGEIGHITILDGGPSCSCGNFGCLEAMAGGQAIARKAIEAVRAGRRTRLASILPSVNITAKDVVAAARIGDLVAQQIVAEAGMYLGTAIANLINLFNPNMVVVGGGVAQAGDLLLDPIRQTVREHSLRSAAQAVRITAAVLDRRSSSMGAVAQAINVALHQQVGI